MRLLALALCAAVLLSGCLSTTSVSSTSDRSTSCDNDACEACVDGECFPCERDQCDACMDDRGACLPTPGPSAPPQDFDVQETHTLEAGFAETTYTFDVAPDATGHVHITLADPAAGEASVLAGACFRYDIQRTNGHSSGGEGACGTSLGVSASTSASPKVVAWWDGLRGAGHYSLTLSAPPQPNELTIDIHVDNP